MAGQRAIGDPRRPWLRLTEDDGEKQHFPAGASQRGKEMKKNRGALQGHNPCAVAADADYA